MAEEEVSSEDLVREYHENRRKRTSPFDGVMWIALICCLLYMFVYVPLDEPWNSVWHACLGNTAFLVLTIGFIILVVYYFVRKANPYYRPEK